MCRSELRRMSRAGAHKFSRIHLLEHGDREETLAFARKLKSGGLASLDHATIRFRSLRLDITPWSGLLANNSNVMILVFTGRIRMHFCVGACPLFGSWTAVSS